MRVLLLNQFYSPDIAATGQYLSDLADGLLRSGHEVHVVCSRRAYAGGIDRQPRKELLGGVRVHHVAATGFGRGSLLGRLLDYLSFYLLAAWRAIRLPRMDVCVALTTPPFIGLLGAMLKNLRGTRLVLWTMDLYPEVPVAYGVMKSGSVLHRLLSHLSRSLYGQASHIISLGEVMTERLIAAGADPQKITTVHNWVPGESVRPIPLDQSSARQSWGINGRVAIMYSGNLGLGHDLQTIVRAAKRLQDAAGVSILFVGNGPMRRRLEKLTHDLGLQCVEFHDPVPLESLADSLAAADIHLVSQKPGTQGLIVPSKLYGILAAGRPTIFIGPDDCEAAQILRESGAGLAVSPGNVEAVAEVLTRLAQSAELRRELGKRARAIYELRFGRDRSVSRIMGVIEQAAIGPAHRG